MQPFNPDTAHKTQRRAYNALRQAIGHDVKTRGPFATKHGWAYYLLDVPGQTLSIRSKRQDGRRTFIIHEHFGEWIEKQPRHYFTDVYQLRDKLAAFFK